MSQAVLLDTIQVAATAQPGEPVLVQVSLAGDAPLDTDVTINGLHTREAWLQAPPRLGEWRIPVTAASGADVDQQLVAVAVDGTPFAPALELVRDPFLPMGVVFHLRDLDPDHSLLAANDVYHWQVGQMGMATIAPFASFDLAWQVDDRQPWTDLLVTVTAEHADGTKHQVQRTIVAGSVYRLLRDGLNQVRPPVETDGKAEQTRMFGHLYRAQMRVSNLEPVGLRFTLRRLEWLVAGAELPKYGPDEPLDLRIEPDHVLDLPVEIDRQSAAAGAQGVIVHLFGETDDGVAVHTSGAFDLVRARRRNPVRVPDLEGHPGILDKVADMLEQHANPYELDAQTGGLLNLPENLYTEGLTQRQVWGMDYMTQLAVEHRATLGEELAGVATSIRSLQSAPPIQVLEPAAPIGQAEPGQHIQGIEHLNAVGGLGVAGPAFQAQAQIGQHVQGIEHLNAVGGLGVAGPAFQAQAQHSRAASIWASLTDDHSWVGEFLNNEGGAVVEGNECDPDNLPDPIPEFFACQFTGKYEDRTVPARIMNARKGDIILVPGGNGLIGGLLAHVSPPQRYAHTGIMTRNFDEISHATASEDWLKDHARGVDPLGQAGARQPTDGFEPEALRFQWPGGITQSVESAYGGSEFTSVEGKKHRLAAFNLIDEAFIDGQWQLIPPLVIKPHPLTEHDNPEIRKRLHRVADQARALCVTEADTAGGRQSKLHYRFYCYTDAALTLRPSPAGVVGEAPPEAGWAVGTLPAVCSSLIWLAARRAGEQLEGPGEFTTQADLEADPDRLAGAQVDESTLDGLYLYSEDERRAAAHWLVEYLIDKIYKEEAKQGGWFGGALNEAFSDMADDCAYQITNTFAFDWADGDSKNSDRWENPGMGRAVSPDNLMLWDKPALNGRGLWGYAEPLVHHQWRVESVPVTKWRKTGGPGTLAGAVRFQGHPVPGAALNAGGIMGNTGADGSFVLTLLEGRYILKAEAFRGEAVGMASASVEVEIKHDETAMVQIELQPPPERYRLVVVEADIAFRDDEFTLNPFEDDPDEYDSDRKHWELPVQPWATYKEAGYVKGWGGECRIEARLTAELNPDLSVWFMLSGDLFEGATENSDERDG
jgi:hypothetical protein